VCLADSATAASVPSAALNKTVTISFIASGTARDPVGQTRQFSTAVSEIIYVSSAGRIFRRRVIAIGRASRGGGTAPDDRSTASYQFQGNKLIGVTPWEGGARQITASFDADFTSCTVSIIDGHGTGGIIRRKGPNGAIYEVTSATTSSPRCSIQRGNAFAN
jgi:hypothetical protein